MAKGKKKTTVHKHTPNTERPNGKSWTHPPNSSHIQKGQPFAVGDTMKGTSGVFLKG